MDKTQEHYEKDTKLNTDQPPLFIPFFLDFVPQYFFVFSEGFRPVRLKLPNTP